jgi:transcriptional regulator with GAF, ATPase, and Fis domain
LDRLGILFHTYLAMSAVMFVAGFALLRQKFVHSRTAGERNQVRWLLGAALLATLPLIYLLWTALRDLAEFAFAPLPKLIVYVISLLFTLAYAVSITRYKLLQVGRIVNRGIIYVAISFVATALFCLMVGLTTALVGTYYFRWENALLAGITAMLVVSALGWIRDRFQRALDRRFYREKYQLAKAVRRLSDAVDQLVEPSLLARQFIQSARDAVGAERVAVYLRDKTAPDFELAGRTLWPSLPERLAADSPLVAELAVQGVAADSRALAEVEAELGLTLDSEGTAVGLVLVGAKQEGPSYTAEDRNFLAALARTTALALRGAQGYRTIAVLKEELSGKVQKIAEQQRRISFLQSELLNSDRSGTASASSREPRSPAAAPPALPLKHDIRGSSLVIRDLLAQVAKIALSPSSVLIRGESGTGKELLARAIHANSPRSARPFVQVHCAALSPGLLESELFGHVKGAFTGADRDKIGRFELADGGTLFLDEIGDINLETQTKLLRVLQEKSFERVGSAQSVAVDVRLIAATHQDLETLMRQGRFREDLFYRLNVISVDCPPLRERRQDIFELALHFLRIYAARASKPIMHIEEEALEMLADYGWPGNIRQLENAIERAVVLAENDTLGRDDLPPEIVAAVDRQAKRPAPAVRPMAGTARTSERKPDVASERLDVELADLEHERLVEALERCSGNKSRAARLLGIPRSTFFSKLRRHGLE